MNGDSSTNVLDKQCPISMPLPSGLTAEVAFRNLRHLPHVVWFDSSDHHARNGLYSFIGVDPFVWFESNPGMPDPLAELEELARPFQTIHQPNLPPFQGGIAGLFGYDLARTLERLPSPRFVDFPIASLAVGLYDLVLAFDHQSKRSWIVSQGFPATSPGERRLRAEQRVAMMQAWLKGEPSHSPAQPRTIPREELASQFDVGLDSVTSNMSAADYHRMIERAVEYIHAGDIFQVNLSQRLLCPARTDAATMYMKLRIQNPAPYAGYLDLGAWQVCSSSPECFMQIRGRQVQTRPIKGTRGRLPSPEADLYLGDELQLSEKDRAENVMIVDLLRNDLSRVCTSESVRVSELFGLETFAHVKHLVSTVCGELQPGVSPLDVLRASFPGGSITGAPKIRAMEIIHELEPTARGVYCGSLGYIGFDGEMDSNILIRTVTAGGGWWQFSVGGGIVAQSKPDDEYRETWHKARGMLEAIG